MTSQIEETWPESLPAPFLSYGGAPRHGTITTPLSDIALTARRERFKKAYADISVRWHFTEAQFVAFQNFFQDDLGNGAALFAIDLRYPANSSMQDWVVRFTGGYGADWLDGRWRVDASLDLITTAELPDRTNLVGYGLLYVQPEDSSGNIEPLLTSDGEYLAVLNE